MKKQTLYNIAFVASVLMLIGSLAVLVCALNYMMIFWAMAIGVAVDNLSKKQNIIV